MSAITTIIDELLQADAIVKIHGDGLRINAPKGAIGDDLRQRMRFYKLELMTLLDGRVSWAMKASALLAGIGDTERRIALRDSFEERAAIAEHDGGLSLDDAERLAFEELAAALGAMA
jgi:hypothetical protein